MPVDFQLDRLRVERFRGIADLELSFSLGTPTYLIGGPADLSVRGPKA